MSVMLHDMGREILGNHTSTHQFIEWQYLFQCGKQLTAEVDIPPLRPIAKNKCIIIYKRLKIEGICDMSIEYE